MKRIYIAIVGVLFCIQYAFSQVPDTLDSHFKNSQATVYPALMGPSMVGYISGYSLYEDKAKMQLFDAAYGVTEKGVITSLLFDFAKRSGKSPSSITATVWEDSAGVPYKVIGSAVLKFDDIPTSYTQIKTTNAEYNTEVKFATPIPIPDNKKFWAGFTMYVTPSAMQAGDTIALITSVDPTPGDASGKTGDFPDAKTHTFEQLRQDTSATSNIFQSFNNGGNTWMLDIALAVFPVVELSVGINAQQQASSTQFQVFPNPNDGNFELQITNYDLRFNNAEVRIYNVLGEKVYQQTLNTKQQTLNTKLPEGMYIYKLITDSEVISKKMLINK